MKVPDNPPQAVENGRHQVNDKIFRKLEEVRSVLIGETLDTDSLSESSLGKGLYGRECLY